MTKSLSLAFALALGAGACGSPTPVPAYPFPASTPIEETDLAAYLDLEPVEEPVEEEWDDGLSDGDLQVGPAEGEGDEADESTGAGTTEDADPSE